MHHSYLTVIVLTPQHVHYIIQKGHYAVKYVILDRREQNKMQVWHATLYYLMLKAVWSRAIRQCCHCCSVPIVKICFPVPSSQHFSFISLTSRNSCLNCVFSHYWTRVWGTKANFETYISPKCTQSLYSKEKKECPKLEGENSTVNLVRTCTCSHRKSASNSCPSELQAHPLKDGWVLESDMFTAWLKQWLAIL